VLPAGGSDGLEVGAGAPSAVRANWVAATAVLCVGIAALLALFSNTAGAVVGVWYESSTFNHGFLILPICGYLIWIRRGRLACLAPGTNLWGLAGLAAGALAWLFGQAMGAMVVQQFALVAMIQALCFTVLGWRATVALGFPLAYLYFAVPFGAFLVRPLQDVTAAFVVRGLQLTGVPVFLDGLLISIPTGNFEVAEACAGVRFLIATMAVGVLFAHLFYRAWWRRVLFIAMAAAVPIVANGFRAYGIVMIAYLSDHRLAVDVDHLIYGWIFLAFVTFLVLLLGMWFRETGGHAVPAESPTGAVPATDPAASVGRLVTAGLAAILVAAAAPAYAAYVEGRPAATLATPLPVPEVRAPWVSLSASDEQWRPVFPGAGAETLRRYAAGDRTVDVYVAMYSRQQQGAEVVGSQNKLADWKAWTRLGGGRTPAVVDGTPMTVAFTRIRRRAVTRLIWHWYWVDGRFTANPYVAKLLQAKAMFLGGIRAAAVVAVASDYRETPAEAAPALHDFLDKMAPLDATLRRLARPDAP
jgi:exosortase A